MRGLGGRQAGVLLGLLAVGCVGTHAGSLRPANEPAGVVATLHASRPGFAHEPWELRRERLAGELLAVQDTAFLLLIDRRLTLIPYGAVRHGFAEQQENFYLSGRAPNRGLRERLRLVSRYPQGVSPELLARLLAAYGQPAVDVVQR